MPAPFPKVLGNGWLGRAATVVNLLLIRVSRSLFSYQILVIAEATPDVDFILQHAKRQGEVQDRTARDGHDEPASVAVREATPRG